KQMIAKAILFKSAHKIIRPMFPAFQANITSYTVSILALKLGATLNLNRIWQEQSISPQLHRQIAIWAEEVNDALHRGAGGKMISEWAKKIECWWRVRDTSYSSELGDITELS
ncbi:abortive phage infection protein, partial [Pseudomonas aeruginosa]